MMNPRFLAILDASKKVPLKIKVPKDENGRITAPSKYFGINTFSVVTMKEYVPSQQYMEIVEHLGERKPFSTELAKVIADAVKKWAINKGATHFCHWFQPQTGLTAEKHDSFLSFDDNDQPIDQFNAEQLVKGEPDASSFPSGGIRSTFEARGYTAWDPTSPMFLDSRTNGITLCIPSVFISYTGEVLDEKTPLLRSLEALNKSACTLLNKLGYDKVNRVDATLGFEQEYFVIDDLLATLRPDLVMTGRTLIGSKPVKGQELEDNYFGSIPRRVHAFIHDLEVSLYKLGIPAKTRHNEVAPGQYEFAPIFRDAALAADHNQIVMETLKRRAEKHGFKVLLHEKPFDGVNGNGKHNNWSLRDNLGNNLLDPGTNAQDNLRFLSILSCVVKAVHKHSGLLRASIASSGNDKRLGANEAPPAIISVYLGQDLTGVLNNVLNGNDIPENQEEAMIYLKISQLPRISKDNTDRNRTSPFAFTGNKFEFRAVGGSQSVSFPTTALSASVAESINEFVSEFEKSNDAIAVIKEFFKEALPVLFEGDNYDPKWAMEAGKRGLKNLRGTPEALKEMLLPQSIALFGNLEIMSENEVKSKYMIRLERYIKSTTIEIETLKEILDSIVIPIAIEQQNKFSSHSNSYVKRFNETFDSLLSLRNQMDSVIERVNKHTDIEQCSLLLRKEWVTLETQIRDKTDIIETLVDDRVWPLPKAREMLHIH